MKDFSKKFLNKIKDHMLLGSIYDNLMKNTKYRDKRLSETYNIMIAQKHRMLYYKMLKRKYLSRCTKDRDWENKPKKPNKGVIWMSWLSGEENAPLLVKRCFESVRRQFPDKKIVVIDENNYNDYIELPDYIIEKYETGIIGPAHFCDLIRIAVLIKYGGCWIDATVLCTDRKLLDYVFDEPLFMYSFYYFGFNPEIMELNNWLICSRSNNNILCLIQKLLYEYWKNMDRAVNYFIFQIFTTIAVEYYSDEFAKMPIVSQVDSHILATYIFDEFDRNKYEILCSQTGIHKLSTRFDESQKSKKGTFYDVIITKGEF